MAVAVSVCHDILNSTTHKPTKPPNAKPLLISISLFFELFGDMTLDNVCGFGSGSLKIHRLGTLAS
jgi:hypothetical protein